MNEKRKILEIVARKMYSYWASSTIPIVGIDDLRSESIAQNDPVRSIGSGTIFNYNRKPLILTAGHVAKKAETFKLVSTGDENGIGFINILSDVKGDRRLKPLVLGVPNKKGERDGRLADVALMAIDPSQIKGLIARDINSMRAASSPPRNTQDAFWFAGFPASQANFSSFGDVVTRYSRVTTESTRSSEIDWFDEEIHIALIFSQEAVDTQGNSKSLLDPHGLSGAAIWKTNVNLNGIEKWHPSHARIVGVITRWDPVTHSLVGTRVEVVTRMLEYAEDWLNGNEVGRYHPPSII